MHCVKYTACSVIWNTWLPFIFSPFTQLYNFILSSFAAPHKTGVILAMALIGKSTIAGGWAAVQIFSAEKFPTLVRNLGIASCAFGARVGGVLAPQIVSLVSLNHFSAYVPCFT